MSKKVNVNLFENSYQVFIGDDSLEYLVKKINKSNLTKAIVIIDSNADYHHKLLLRKIVALIECKTFFYSLIVSEKNKSLITVQKIFSFLSENSFDRSSAVIAIGGGVVGDIAGYVASTFMRGIRLFQVPTTLLSMVDSSVGGKTGVNFQNRKNLIGTFYQPNIVCVYPEFIKSLTKREIVSGAGEIFKYSFLADGKNYNLLKSNLQNLFNNDDVDFISIITNCVKIKADVVMNDEREVTGLRKILNLGHTFAHAFETESNFKLKHGEAVIAGIFCALSLSEKSGYLDQKKFDKILQDFSFISLNKSIYKMDTVNVYYNMIGDKKNLNNKIKLVLVEDIGSVIVDVVLEKSLIVESIEWVKKNIR